MKVPYRRKRLGKTNYKQRLRLLLSSKPRLVVRRSSHNISVQLVEYHPEGDKVIVSAQSRQLKQYGWKTSRSNLPAAYLTGLLLGTRALKKNVKEAVLDIGLSVSTKGSRLYAALQGALDAGLKVPHGKDMLPAAERNQGAHIAAHAKKLDPDKLQRYYAHYIKEGIDVPNFPQYFEKVKEQIK